jgi:type I restriction enzyme M protein
MLDQATKHKIDTARQILVGKVPDPKAQVEQITTALIYKFMDDMDKESIELGGEARFFTDGYSQYSWTNLLDNKLSGQGRLDLYVQAITNIPKNPNIPQLFRDIFKGAFLPFRDPRTLTLFLKEINEFTYEHSENLGNAFEYLLSIMGSQGDAGQFRTPRHIIDFIVEAVDPKKNETILDPACGTAGFLISAYKYIKKQHDGKDNTTGKSTSEEKRLTPDEKTKMMSNFVGYDISPDMVKLSLVNLYLHGFPEPKIQEYDTLSSEEKWDETFDVVFANPPFMTPKGGIRPHKRFSIRANRAEVLFVDYIAEHLNINGRAGIIVPEGIIFQSSNAYKQLRKNLVENWGLYAVVSLPAGVFQPYSGVKTSILFLNKELSKKTAEILFVKVESDGFDLGAQRRKNSKNDLVQALNILSSWKINSGVCELGSIAQIVAKEQIVESGDYNLTGDRYREATNYSDTQWSMVELGELFEMQNGRAFKRDEWKTSGVPIIRIANLNSNDASYNYYDGIYDKKIEINKGDLLFSWSGTKGTSFGPHLWNRKKGLLNQHIYKFVVKEKNIINLNFAHRVITSIIPDIEAEAHGAGGLVHITKAKLQKFKIPIPPIEIQKQIISEIDGYQRIIDGAKQVVKNWKPSIKIDPEWKTVEFKEVCTLEYGKGLPKKDRVLGKYPVMGSNGQCGTHNNYLIEGPAIIVGRKGSAGEVVWEDKDCFPIDTTYFVKLQSPSKTNLRFIYFILKLFNMSQIKGGAGIPGLNRNDVYKKYKIPFPPLEIQKQIVAKIKSEQELVDSSKKLIEIFEQKIADKIDEVWGK